MRTSIRVFVLVAMVAAITIFVVSPVVSQDKPADTMQILRDKVKADKRLVIAANLGLTESEAKGFWPVYEAYQKDLEAIYERTGKLIQNYATEYQAETLTDEKAKPLIDELLAVEQAESGLLPTYVPKLSKVLPPIKVARYLQIENKIRAALRYDLAMNIPLMP